MSLVCYFIAEQLLKSLNLVQFDEVKCYTSESTVRKIVHKFSSAICELKDDYIKFPNATDQATYKVDSYEYWNFPGVIGCIDGCHIPIKCISTADAEDFRNK